VGGALLSQPATVVAINAAAKIESLDMGAAFRVVLRFCVQ
jgi:hypothetical protein